MSPPGNGWFHPFGRCALEGTGEGDTIVDSADDPAPAWFSPPHLQDARACDVAFAIAVLMSSEIDWAVACAFDPFP